ncbi:MAG: aspartate carbamoyltransferase regulatory subunit [Nanohaloarchaea archaeon]|nr:aspartate carbamoyltransferase regulatory subunit [Candidatus Nanohaloarchaea archaeon]
MTEQRQELIITKLKDGTVIDHIPQGKSLDILNALGILKKTKDTIAVIMCVDSKKIGKKDLLKLNNFELEHMSAGKIAVIAPGSTIAIVKDYRVVSKCKAAIPDVLVSSLRCINSNCISNTKEDITSRFKVVSKEPLKVRCHYCERTFSDDGIVIDV